jgi:hypothetical protein
MPQPNAAADREMWCYQVDGRVHGPAPLDAIVELIAASGDTASEVLVRRGNDGPWIAFHSLPGMSGSRGPDARSASNCSATASDPGQQLLLARSSSRPDRDLIHKNRDFAIAVAAWLLVNVIVLFAFPRSNGKEREYYATLRGFDAEIKTLRERDASQQEWAAFRGYVNETLKPIVNDLKRGTSAKVPIRQHLLWAARDHFPKLVGPMSAEMREPQRLYERHMQIVEEEMAR